MAERIPTFTPLLHKRYPWEQWIDGSIWRIKRGEDFQSETKTLRSYLYNQARAHQLSVVTAMPDEDTLEFQFSPKNGASA